MSAAAATEQTIAVAAKERGLGTIGHQMGQRMRGQDRII